MGTEINNKSLIETLWEQHHQLGLRLNSPLSELLRERTTVECISIEQIPHERFGQFNINALWCLMNIWQSQIMFGIPNGLGLNIAAQLLNYPLTTTEIEAARPLGQDEKVSLMRFVDLLNADLEKQWKLVISSTRITFQSIVDQVAEFSKYFKDEMGILVVLEVSQNAPLGKLMIYYPPDVLISIKPDTKLAELPLNADPEMLAVVESVAHKYFQQIMQRLDRLEEQVEILDKEDSPKRWWQS